MNGIPRIKKVVPAEASVLLVSFENGIDKIYDCQPLFSLPVFSLLRVPAFFRAVKVAAGGYGVYWNDEIDLREYELWSKGISTAKPAHPRESA